MSEEKMIEILNMLKIFINGDSKDLAKEYLKMEIDNLTGTTE